MEETEQKTLEQAAESLLAPIEEEVKSEEVETEEAPLEVQETDAVEIETEDADGEGEEPSLENAEDETDEDASEEPETFTVKFDGTETEATLDELIRSFSGQKHIQRKMEETATIRKEADASKDEVKTVFDALQQERAQLAAFGKQLQETGLQQPTPPNPDLIHQDPIKYMEDQALYEVAKADYSQKANQFQQMTAQQRKAESDAQGAYIRQQAELLNTFIPEFSDPEKGTVIRDSIMRVAQDEYGFNDQELNAIVDARHIRVLNDARKWRELQTNKKQTIATAKKKARPAVRAGAKKVAADPRRVEKEAALKSLKATGSLDDAVRLIMEN